MSYSDKTVCPGRCSLPQVAYPPSYSEHISFGSIPASSWEASNAKGGSEQQLVRRSGLFVVLTCAALVFASTIAELRSSQSAVGPSAHLFQDIASPSGACGFVLQSQPNFQPDIQ